MKKLITLSFIMPFSMHADVKNMVQGGVNMVKGMVPEIVAEGAKAGAKMILGSTEQHLQIALAQGTIDYKLLKLAYKLLKHKNTIPLTTAEIWLLKKKLLEHIGQVGENQSIAAPAAKSTERTPAETPENE